MTFKQPAVFHVVHLIRVFFFRWYEKGLLNFVSERKMLVYRITNTRLAFQTSKPQFKLYRSHTPELGPYLDFNYCFTGATLKNI